MVRNSYSFTRLCFAENNVIIILTFISEKNRRELKEEEEQKKKKKLNKYMSHNYPSSDL